MGVWNRIDWPVEDMRRWYEVDGLSVTDIAVKLDKNPKLVWKVCKKHRFHMRPVGASYGEKNPSWRGGRKIDKGGYILILKPDHPFADKTGYVREHRLVAEKVLGRYLGPTEVVHHKDEDTSNNDLDNLAVYETNAKHLADTLKGRCPKWTEDGQRKIRESIRLCWPDCMSDWYTLQLVSTSKIAILLDRSASAVRRELKRRGVPVRASHGGHDNQKQIPDSVLAEAAALEPKYRGNPKRGARQSRQTIDHSTGQRETDVPRPSGTDD